MECNVTAQLLNAFPGCCVLSVERFGAGTGFLSAMHLCEVKKVDGEHCKIVTKETPPFDHSLHTFTLPLHKQEIRFYQHFKGSLQHSICPTTVHDSVLLLDYLEGYSMPNFQQGMTEREVKLALESLAPVNAQYWSAPGATIEFPEWLTQVSSVDMILDLYNQFMEPAALLVEGSKEFLLEIGNNCSFLLERFMDSSMSQGVIHGDLWNNNILVTKENCTLVDWQFCSRKNPLIDVAFLLTSSVSPPLRNQNEKAWIKLYHEALLKYTNAREDNYPLESCLNEYEEAKIYSLIIMIASFDSFYLNIEEKETVNDVKQRYISLINESMCLYPGLMPKN